MKDLIIAGYGGFGKEVEWLVQRINDKNPTWNFKGYISKEVNKSDVIADDKYVINYEKELFAVIAVGASLVREKIFNAYRTNPNIKFPNRIDPSVQCSKKITMGVGNIVCAGTIMTVDVEIGNFNIINLDCTIGHDVVIKDFVTINPSVNISGGTVLESGSNIGTGTKTVQYVTIGKNSVVGAGAVVNHDLPDDCTAVGVPARVIQIRE